MDQFEFKALMGHVSKLKTLKDLEACIRSQGNKIDNYPAVDSSNVKTTKLQYMAYSYTLKRFREKSYTKLPTFLYTKQVRLEYSLTEFFFVDQTQKLSYDEYIELFQYTEIINFCRYSSCTTGIFKALAETIKDNPDPYVSKYNYHTNTYYNLITGHYSTSVLSSILAIEHIKQNLDPSIKYTAIENELARLYEQINKDDIETCYKKHLELKQVFETTLNKVVKK